MSKIAYLTQVIETGQYILHCMGQKIAETNGDSHIEHELWKSQMIKEAAKLGYTILNR